MNIEKMFEMQKELDMRIIKEHGLEGQDLLPNTVLALQVEIAELANEWRGFKHWSIDQEPRTKIEEKCTVCLGTGDENSQANIESLLEGWGGYPHKTCEECNGAGISGYRNPLLEEYVDCLHFFLSVARQINYPLDDLIHLHAENLEEGPLVYVFIELLQHVGWLALHIHPEVRKRAFEFAFVGFVNLGKRLGFSPEQIEQAYLEKNQINHERQSTGY
ncbi:dUTP diphosphatase [Paenibacillus larvae]